MRYQHTPIQTFKIYKISHINVDENIEQQELSHTLLVEMENGTTTLERSFAIFYKVKHTALVSGSVG